MAKRDPGIVKLGKEWHKLVLLPNGGIVVLKADKYRHISELLRRLK